MGVLMESNAMAKPQNPATLDASGLALLATLADPYRVFPLDPTAAYAGEPLALPADLYAVQLSPRGDMMLGWSLTEAGIAAWPAPAATANTGG